MEQRSSRIQQIVGLDVSAQRKENLSYDPRMAGHRKCRKLTVSCVCRVSIAQSRYQGRPVFQEERNRILQTYEQRKSSGISSLYHWSKADVLVSDFSRERAAAKLLLRAGKSDISEMDILDVGCGTGQWLIQLMQWGATPSKLHGIDLLADRIDVAQSYLPNSVIDVTEGWPLPFEGNRFDLICANTVISSIHEPEARAKLAGEMLRICHPQGAIMIYDFQINKPGSTDTIALKKSEVQRIFPQCVIDTQSLILAPPINRRVAPVSCTLAILMEAMLPFLRTHVMYLIRPMS